MMKENLLLEKLTKCGEYGGCSSLADTNDEELENKLLEIVKWIDGELKRL